MRRLVEQFVRRSEHLGFEELVPALMELFDSKEFAERFAQRIKPPVDLGLGDNVNQKWRILMSALTDAMAAVGAVISANTAAVDPAHMASVDSAIKALKEHDAAEDPQVADAIAGLQALHDAVIPPVAEPAPAPSPEPSPAAAAE